MKTGYAGCSMKWMNLLLCMLLIPVTGAMASETYRDGLIAYEKGEYEKAFEIFMALFRSNPGDEDLNYSMGLAAARAGRVSHAIFAYERALTLNPENGPARLELGRNWMSVRQYDLARDEFDRLLALHPPEDIRRAAESELDRLAKFDRKWRFEGEATLSAIWDDNSNYGPESDVIRTASGNYAADADIRPDETWGSAGSAKVLYTYDFGDANGWEYSLGGHGYIKRHEKAPDEEISFIRADAILRHVRRNTLLELPLKVSAAEYGNSHLFNLLGSEPMFLYAVRPKLQILARGNVEYRDYKRDDERDALFGEAGLILRRLPEGRQPLLSVQVHAFNEDAESEAYDNDGWRAVAYGNVEVVSALYLYASVQYRETFYDAVLYPGYQAEPRDEEQMQYTVGLQSTAIPHCTLDFSFRHTDNRANFDLYDYDKNVATISTTFTF